MSKIKRFFGYLYDSKPRTTKVRRPGAGPILIAFSRAEVEALAEYTTGYPLEEATTEELDAFHSGLDKIKSRRKQA